MHLSDSLQGRLVILATIMLAIGILLGFSTYWVTGKKFAFWFVFLMFNVGFNSAFFWLGYSLVPNHESTRMYQNLSTQPPTTLDAFDIIVNGQR